VARSVKNSASEVETPPKRDLSATLEMFYDFYRDCALNEEYYGLRAHRLDRAGFWLEIATFLGSTGSGISGWGIWTMYPQAKNVWLAIAAIVAVVSSVKPLFQLSKKAERYHKLFGEYRAATVTMQDIVQRIAAARGVTADIEREYRQLRQRYRTLSVEDDPRPNSKLVQRLQQRVNNRIPADEFWLPE
jgi:hypothetical protein